MLSEETIKSLEKQQYRVIGKHSAVKICTWTKKNIRGEGSCYKQKFYGIRSSQCLQMTTSMSCANRCVYCWRDYKAPVAKEWQWLSDSPQMILEQSLHFQKKLLEGLKGYKNVDMHAYQDSLTVRHAALSLNGEPILYPHINELITLFHKLRISTFLVTNGQYPETIRDLVPVTQLYLSIGSPDAVLLKEVEKPLFSDYWERLLRSLDYLKQKKQRTCIRITVVKDLNMVKPELYANLIKRGNPHFVELKAYMLLGASKERLRMSNMPLHEEVVAFAHEIESFLTGYELVAEHRPSRAVLFAKKTFKKGDQWMTWIDFEKFFALDTTSQDYAAEEYASALPELGLQGSNFLLK